MSILKSPGPEGCFSVFAKALANIRMTPTESITFPSPTTDEPLPVYVLGADQAASGDLNDPPTMYRFFFQMAGKSMLAVLICTES